MSWRTALKPCLRTTVCPASRTIATKGIHIFSSYVLKDIHTNPVTGLRISQTKLSPAGFSPLLLHSKLKISKPESLSHPCAIYFKLQSIRFYRAKVFHSIFNLKSPFWIIQAFKAECEKFKTGPHLLSWTNECCKLSRAKFYFTKFTSCLSVLIRTTTKLANKV